MAQNIEIKAYAKNFSKQRQIAQSLTDKDCITIPQEDIFFNVPQGKLKLRIFSPDQGQLIYYNRPEQQGPKLSQYQITETKDPSGLKNVLKEAYGIRNIVSKIRYLYMKGRTRIHFDKVKSLGEVIELEVVLSASSSISEGESEAQKLMDQLEIKPSHLIENAYIDLLEAK